FDVGNAENTHSATSERKYAMSSSTITVDSCRYYIDAENMEAALYTYGKKGKTAIVPETITYDGNEYTVIQIGYGGRAFPDSITSIQLPESLVTIRSSACNGCKSLLDITLPASLEAIGDFAFKDCTSLTSITIPDKVTVIDNYAFYGCTSLSNVKLSASLETIGYQGFYNCSSLTAITIPDKVTTIDSYAFYGCTSLSNIKLSASLETIGSYAFYNCSSFSDITLSASLETIGSYAFYNCSSLAAINIPDKVTTINPYTFWGCKSLSEVTLPASLETIGSYAFFNCTPLTAITIPDKVTTIDTRAFSQCSLLYDVNVMCTTPPTIGSDVFIYTNLYSINVPKGSGAAYSAASYWSNYIIVDGDGVSLNINVDEAGTLGEKILAETENVYDVNYLTLSGTLNSDDIYNIQNRMPNLIGIDMENVDMTELPSDMFKSRNALKKIVLPSNLQSIGSDAMYGCSNLKEISLPKTLESIGSYAFYVCESLLGIVIPDGVTSIGTYAFYSCASLRNVTLPSTLTSVPDEMFDGCTRLETVEFPEGITKIGDRAFNDNSNLKAVTFPSTLERIERQPFLNCTSLTEITLPEKLVFCYRSFENCSNITKVTCEALVPPFLQESRNIMNGVDKSGCTLYVPELSINDYKLSVGWDEFTNIKGIEYYPENITVFNDYKLTLPDSLPSDWKPTVELTENPNSSTDYGTLTVNGNPTLSMELFTLDYDLNTYLSYYSNTSKTAYNSLVSNANMRADNICTNVYLKNNYWAFLSFPYDVNVSDITPVLDETSWVIRKYSGLARANSDMDNTWQNITIDGTLQAGEGYIWQCTRSGTSYCQFIVPAINNTNKNNIFTKDAVTLTLNEYQSEFSHNRSWNLVGNPYPCFYDSRFMEFSAPITVWNDYSRTYEAYSLTDDSRILRPGEAFFVQRPVDSETIVFPTDGRQTDRSVRDLTSTYSSVKRVQAVERDIFNLYITDGNISDKTRFVINPTAQSAYETTTDASKFMSSDKSVAQLYTIEDGIQMSINERPFGNGIVLLGTYFGSQGSYTISLDTQSDMDVTLVDKSTGIETNLNVSNYTFDADAGTVEDRFYIKLINTTGINSINAENGNAITVEGNRIVVNGDGNALISVYTTDGKAVAYGNGSVDTSSMPAGLYIVKANGSVRKVRVTK
ncbi:MAG: leucine-rich repeat domain-containing protein, partial [Prevotella sp.]|nr:leucine-rich repeat domain-containing protein [Prevotella sp.]